MMTSLIKIRSLTLIAVTLLGTFATASRARAVDVLDDPVQIDDRMSQIMQTSNSLCWEMYRYHQQDADYAQAYRTAKDIWNRANQFRDAIRTSTVETEALIQQANEINNMTAQLETTLSRWGDGDRSTLVSQTTTGQRTVVTQGVGVDLPLVGIRLGTPQVVVTDDGVIPRMERHRLHPNSPGSKRSLEREFNAMKLAVSYLVEDAGVSAPAPGAAPTVPSTNPGSGPTPATTGPTPDPTLSSPNTAANSTSRK